MIISFSGTSGSGKTTIINEIISRGIFKDRKVVVKQEDSFVTIRVLKYILGENLFSKYKEEKFFKIRYTDIFYKLFVVLSYIFYPAIVYIEFLTDHIRYEIIQKNTVLLVDKFVYDHIVQFKDILEIDNTFVEWLFAHFPKPYLSFMIDIDIATALLRNKNNIPSKITAKRLFHENILENYRKTAEKNNILTINNNGDMTHAVKNIITHIINKEKILSARKIAICGLDGTGKTTIANMLGEYATFLNIQYKIVHFVHNNLLYRMLLHLGYYNFDLPKKLIYKKSREHSARERIKKTSFVKAFLRFFDSYVQYLFYTTIYRNKLIIFDRYFYDYLVSFEYLDIKWRSFFDELIPHVRNKFLFEISPNVAYKRKPERVKTFFIECHEIYLKVARENNIKIIRTDNKSSEQILEELIEGIS